MEVKMGKLPTAVDRATYEQELERARQENRDPQWSSFDEFLKENISEEDQVWGSQSMKDYGRKGRHDSHGTTVQHDKDNGVKTTGAESTTYQETVPTPEELDELATLQREQIEVAKADGTVDETVYDPNVKLGAAIAAGLSAGVASSEGSHSSEEDESDNSLSSVL